MKYSMICTATIEVQVLRTIEAGSLDEAFALAYEVSKEAIACLDVEFIGDIEDAVLDVDLEVQ